MEHHRGVSPCGSAPFPGKNVSQHLRNGAIRDVPRASEGEQLDPQMSGLKAIFFVPSLEGKPEYTERKTLTKMRGLRVAWRR